MTVRGKSSTSSGRTIEPPNENFHGINYQFKKEARELNLKLNLSSISYSPASSSDIFFGLSIKPRPFAAGLHLPHVLTYCFWSPVSRMATTLFDSNLFFVSNIFLCTIVVIVRHYTLVFLVSPSARVARATHNILTVGFSTVHERHDRARSQ